MDTNELNQAVHEAMGKCWHDVEYDECGGDFRSPSRCLGYALAGDLNVFKIAFSVTLLGRKDAPYVPLAFLDDDIGRQMILFIAALSFQCTISVNNFAIKSGDFGSFAGCKRGLPHFETVRIYWASKRFAYHKTVRFVVKHSIQLSYGCKSCSINDLREPLQKR